MRETGPVRKQVDGDDEAAIAQMGAARVQLGIMKNTMKLGGLPMATRTLNFEDGTQMRVSSIHGQDSITVVGAPATPAPAEPEVIELPAVDVELPVVEVPAANGEKYSQPYSSAILLGAVTDKTATTVMFAYAAPNYDQQFAFYVAPVPNSSQLVRLDANMKELGRTLVAQPDWGGQLTYDAVTDQFFMNAFTATDDRSQSWFNPFGSDTGYKGHPTPNFAPHRSLLLIGKDGAQQEVTDPDINLSGETYPNTTWGNTTFVQGYTAVRAGSSNEGAYTVFGFGVDTMGGYGTYGSHRTSQVFPLSQPSTSGLIAAMFQGMGNSSVYGPQWSNQADWMGYAFLWSTSSQQIVWRGNGLGNFRGTDDTGGYGQWTTSVKFDPWAHVTPTGNAVFSVGGVLAPVQLGGGAFSIGSPPPGIIDIAFTHADAQAFGITTGGAFNYTLRTNRWVPLALDGAPLAVLHDVVTDAVAIVMADASGVWIFNGKSRNGTVIAPFKVRFRSPPVADRTRIYPQQFINGTLLITYALPWDGARGSTGQTFVYAETNGSNTWSGIPAAGLAAQRAMGAHYYADTQRPTAWRAQLGQAGIVQTDGALGGNWLPTPNGAADGSIDPVQWIIGRYDIGALKQ
jgi:hypothetical protein